MMDFIKPDVRLKDYVDACYYSEGDSFPTESYSNVPTLIRSWLIFHIDGGVKVLIDEDEFVIPKTCIKASFDKPFLFKFLEPKVSAVIVQFSVSGLYELTGIDLSTIKNTYHNAYSLWGQKLLDSVNTRLSETKDKDQRISIVTQFVLGLIEKRQAKKVAYKVEVVKNALDIAQEKNFNLSLVEVCNELAISPKTLERTFKTVIGITPKQYFSGRLFEYLMHEIRHNRDKQFSDILNSPFYDYSHINKWFSRYSNIPPSMFNQMEYRVLETVLKHQTNLS
ncbi:MAG: helix-turn-helix domain-containing protein [Flavobacteriales bacterium]